MNNKNILWSWITGNIVEPKTSDRNILELENNIEKFISKELEITKNKNDRLWFGFKNDKRDNRIMTKLHSFLLTHKIPLTVRLIKQIFEKKIKEKGATINKFSSEKKKSTVYIGLKFKSELSEKKKLDLNEISHDLKKITFKIQKFLRKEYPEIPKKNTEIPPKSTKLTRKMSEIAAEK